jgi:hypothetical protein
LTGRAAAVATTQVHQHRPGIRGGRVELLKRDLRPRQRLLCKILARSRFPGEQPRQSGQARELSSVEALKQVIWRF